MPVLLARPTLQDSDSESLAARRIVAGVKSYVVELPARDAADLADAGERARTAAEQLTREGTAVRWVRSVYTLEYETGLLVFEAHTPQAVDRAGRRAGLTYTRIVEGGRPT
jgi:hypothetical protein